MNLDLRLPEQAVREMVRQALREDIGRGDLTTAATVPMHRKAKAALEFRTGGIVCGLPVMHEVFRALDPEVRVTEVFCEGAELSQAAVVAHIEGGARSILTGERVMLNAIARLSATATLTRRYVRAISGTKAQILDTRKTTPGLRLLEKYAVRVGGGTNHRFGLDDGILIKDNHVAIAGGIADALRLARLSVPPGMRIEIEVDTLEQLREALANDADMVLLDNMDAGLCAEAVELARHTKMRLEASGGINLTSVRGIAETGVHFISVGALTHSAGALDVALEVEL